MNTAPLIEIFTSVQGEGRFAGVPMTFLRTAVCPIRCLYCDTPESHVAPPACTVHRGDRQWTEPNPVSVARVLELLTGAGSSSAEPRRTRYLSITGGEPLVHPAFVTAVGVALRSGGWRVHLETAALHDRALREVLAEDAIDHLSADYKLPETLAAGDFRAAHGRCLALACGADSGISVDVKLVITPAVTAASLERALAELAPHRERLLLVLQPVTPFGEVAAGPDPTALGRMAELAVSRGFDVRVLPQLHKALGLR